MVPVVTCCRIVERAHHATPHRKSGRHQDRSVRRGGAGSRMSGNRQQHHPGLADDLSGEKVERTEGEPEEHDRVDHKADQARRDHGRDEAALVQAAYRPRDRRIRKADRPSPTRSRARAARPAPEMPAPIRIAATATPKPSRRCTRSRSTSATPIISTPDGAIRAGRDRDEARPVAACRRCRHSRSSSWPPEWSGRTGPEKASLRSSAGCRCVMFVFPH